MEDIYSNINIDKRRLDDTGETLEIKNKRLRMENIRHKMDKYVQDTTNKINDNIQNLVNNLLSTFEKDFKNQPRQIFEEEKNDDEKLKEITTELEYCLAFLASTLIPFLYDTTCKVDAAGKGRKNRNNFNTENLSNAVNEIKDRIFEKVAEFRKLKDKNKSLEQDFAEYKDEIDKNLDMVKRYLELIERKFDNFDNQLSVINKAVSLLNALKIVLFDYDNFINDNNALITEANRLIMGIKNWKPRKYKLRKYIDSDNSIKHYIDLDVKSLQLLTLEKRLDPRNIAYYYYNILQQPKMAR